MLQWYTKKVIRKIVLVTLFALALTHAPAYAQHAPVYREYHPQAGDLILYHTHDEPRGILTGLITGAMITHSGIVVEDAEGKMWLMHAVTRGVVVEPLMEALLNDPDDIFIRAVKKPLTSEQNKTLSQFAKSEEGKSFKKKDFAIIKTRPTRRTKPPKTRDTYFCSQLVSTACVTANIIRSDKNGRYINPNAITPADLFGNKRLDLRGIWENPIPLIKPPPKKSTQRSGS